MDDAKCSFRIFFYVCKMNSTLRNVLAGLLACTYLLVSFIPANVDKVPLKFNSTDNQGACLAEASVNFPNSALRSENVFSSLTVVFTSDFKNSSKDSGLVHHAYEIMANAVYRFYRSSPVNTLFRFYLTDIIFPFHYFW